MNCRSVVLLLLFVTTLSLIGCASTEKPQVQPQHPSAYSINTDLGSAQNLERFVHLERNDPAVAPRIIPPPPGIDPQVFALHDGSDRRAFLNLSAALEALASASYNSQDHVASASDGHQPFADPSDALGALRSYVKGRELALEGRYYLAITEFNRALELDPHALPVMRELARSHQALGNIGQATEMYNRIVAIDPSDTEAIFSLAIHAANRREWERVGSMLARYYQSHTSFDHDPAAEAIAQYTLATALRSLGYERASIEAARNVSPAIAFVALEGTIYPAHLMALHRQQSDVWRGIGDAHCRLGEYESAIEAYSVAASMPSTDPAALHPRVIYTNLRLGRAYAAQHEMLSILQHVRTEASSTISDRDIRLCVYIAEHVNDLSLLRDQVMQWYQEDRNDPAVVRTAAALHSTDEAAALLRDFVGRNPRNTRLVGDLLTWFGGSHLEAAVELVTLLVESHPDLASEYVTRLILSAPRPARIIELMDTHPPSAASANIECRVLIALGAIGEAWSTCSEARAQWPDDRGLLWLQLELTTLLEEPALLRDLNRTTQHVRDPLTMMYRAKAHRGLGQMEEAIEAAEQAADLVAQHPDDDPLAARIRLEQATTYHAYSATQQERAERVRWAQEAAVVAQRIVESRVDIRTIESAYELLLHVYGPSGPASDPQRFRSVVQRLADVPDSRLFDRLAAEELIGQGRYEPAIERLVNLYDSDPADGRALALVVHAWTRHDQLEAARTWLTEKLEQRPGAPVLLEQWVTVMLRLDRMVEVVETLTKAIEIEPRNFAAIRLLESTYRATGKMDKAYHYGEQRLLALPYGVRRDIELAALYGGVGMERRAMDLLEAVLQNADDAAFDHMIAAVAIIGRLESEPTRRDTLTIAYTTHIIDRFPQAPMQVYALGLGAMAKLDRVDEQFDSLVERAVRNMPQGAERYVAGIWRDLAQALVSIEEPAAAARALRPIIRAEHLLDSQMTGVLTTLAIVCDAAAAEQSQRVADTLELLEELNSTDRLPIIFGMDASEPPTLAMALYAASQMYSLLSNEAGVEKILKHALTLEPDHAMMLNNLGYMRIVNGIDDEQTVEWIERAHEMEPDDSHILDTLGWLRYMQGVWEKVDSMSGARELIETAITGEDEPVAEVHDHLGDVYWRLGRQGDAVEAWEKAKAILADPSHEQSTVQNLLLLQQRAWGIMVADPQKMYDRLYGKQLDRIRAKLHAVRSGAEPNVAPTFEELETATRQAAEH